MSDAARHPSRVWSLEGLVAQQALVGFVAWNHVDGAPEAGPAFETAGSHVPGDWVGGGAGGHRLPSLTQVPGVPATVQTQDFGWPTAGAELIALSPTAQEPVVGAAVAWNVTHFG